MRYITLFVLLSCTLLSCKQEKPNSHGIKNIAEIKLVSLNSDTSIDISKPVSMQQIVSEFGNPEQIGKEGPTDPDDAEPWTVLKYDGLEIEMAGDYIEEITITNRNWTLGDFSIGDPESKVQSKLSPANRNFDNNHHLYLFPRFDGIFFCELNEQNKITRLGVSSPGA